VYFAAVAINLCPEDGWREPDRPVGGQLWKCKLL